MDLRASPWSTCDLRVDPYLVRLGAPDTGGSAGAAQPLRLYRRPTDGEPRLIRRSGQHSSHVAILHLDDPSALPADQELRGMGMAFPLRMICIISRAAGHTADKR